MSPFTKHLNSSSLILIVFLRGRVGPSKLQVRKQVKQVERLDQDHRETEWWNLNPRDSKVKALLRDRVSTGRVALGMVAQCTESQSVMTLPLTSSLTLSMSQTPLCLNLLICEMKMIVLLNSWDCFENSNRLPCSAPRTVPSPC